MLLTLMSHLIQKHEDSGLKHLPKQHLRLHLPQTNPGISATNDAMPCHMHDTL